MGIGGIWGDWGYLGGLGYFFLKESCLPVFTVIVCRQVELEGCQHIDGQICYPGVPHGSPCSLALASSVCRLITHLHGNNQASGVNLMPMSSWTQAINAALLERFYTSLSTIEQIRSDAEPESERRPLFASDIVHDDEVSV